MERPANGRRKIVPAQTKGMKSGAEENLECSTREEAILRYVSARNRLMQINNWHRYMGMEKNIFALTDPDGNLVSGVPEIGFLVRIDLPVVPGSASGQGYDWVRIEAIDEKKDTERDLDFFAFRVRPAVNPKDDSKEAAHFYTEDATSTFLIQRAGTKVTAAEKGRNEVPNVKAEKITDKIRNSVIALGAMAGLSAIQWKLLMNGVLKGED
jgi:hypothetical protein